MGNDYRVVIIGGGIVGCAIAYHLTKLGEKSVAVFEKNYLSSGATGRCGGGIRQQWSSLNNVLLAMRSVKHFERFSEEIGMDIEYKQGGYLVLSYTDEEAVEFEKNVKMQREAGLKVEILSPKEVERRYPYINTEGVKMATFCQSDGHANPHLATFGYARASQKLGADIFTHTEVVDLERLCDSRWIVHTTNGSVKADVVINAAGAFSREVGKLAGVDLPTESYRHQIFVTEPLKDFFDPMAISFSGNYYMRQTKHGNFIMGQGDADERAGINYSVTFRFEKELSRKMARIFPFLRKLRIIRHWSGHYNMSPDAQPIIGESPPVRGYYYAVGFSGHGFMLAPAVGEAIAEMILYGRAAHVDVSDLNVQRLEGGVVKEKNVV